jgi:tRNA threonylcarbamoyladenosine biosynthesis protein TsaE
VTAGEGLGGGLATGVDEHLTVASAAQMRDLGRRLAGVLRAGDLVILSGPLGAGKTTLAQGIGSGLGVRGPITSPTFVIARVHPSLRNGPDLVHADAYRLGSRAEVDDLDLDADLATSVTIVEWGEGLVENLAASYLEVNIQAEAVHAEIGMGETVPKATVPEAMATDEAETPRYVHLRGWGDRWASVGRF